MHHSACSTPKTQKSYAAADDSFARKSADAAADKRAHHATPDISPHRARIDPHSAGFGSPRSTCLLHDMCRANYCETQKIFMAAFAILFFCLLYEGGSFRNKLFAAKSHAEKRSLHPKCYVNVTPRNVEGGRGAGGGSKPVL